jgi:RNA polymerase sigma-70 factor (ECF subfamily)
MGIFKDTEDLELFNKIKQNNSKALDELFTRYYRGLCHFSFKIVKNIELAEEAVADVFLNIWLKRDEIEIKSSLKAYLFTAARNQSLNYHKKNSRIFFEDLELLENENLPSDLAADHSVNLNSTLEEIESIVGQLPEKRQLIFRMNRFDGLSYKEIAEILSISINTVQNQMVKAVKFMLEFSGKI